MKRLSIFGFASLVALGGLLLSCTTTKAQQPRDNSALEPYAIHMPCPKLIGEKSDWINTDEKPITFERGKVYVVEFWTFGCINCQRNLPTYAKWHKQFSKKGVTIIGVHTPETEEEKQTSNVRKQVKSLKIEYPVLLDMKGENWKRYDQQVWPSVYLVDKRGQARWGWIGELGYNGARGVEKMTTKIKELLAEKPPKEEEEKEEKP
ncbi:MAG: redoxin domain-containing protein [Armatimonadetes bacterium]|nr:redoxin domain-containing protein [Armatimonadota bacterium]